MMPTLPIPVEHKQHNAALRLSGWKPREEKRFLFPVPNPEIYVTGPPLINRRGPVLTSQSRQ